jgi:hypothetical protein
MRLTVVGGGWAFIGSRYACKTETDDSDTYSGSLVCLDVWDVRLTVVGGGWAFRGSKYAYKRTLNNIE